MKANSSDTRMRFAPSEPLLRWNPQVRAVGVPSCNLRCPIASEEIARILDRALPLYKS